MQASDILEGPQAVFGKLRRKIVLARHGGVFSSLCTQELRQKNCELKVSQDYIVRVSFREREREGNREEETIMLEGMRLWFFVCLF